MSSVEGVTRTIPVSSYRVQQATIARGLKSRDGSTPSQSPRILLASYDAESIVVYQAYNRAIASSAIYHGHFEGSQFSFKRMTWIKPGFLWMMHRAGWGSKQNQEVILAIRLRRSYFDELLESAVSSSFDPNSFSCKEEWQYALRSSPVAVQWDPDHKPVTGEKQSYRVIQIGIQGELLRRGFGAGTTAIMQIDSVMPFVQGVLDDYLGGDGSGSSSAEHELSTPTESVYPVHHDVAKKLGIIK